MRNRPFSFAGGGFKQMKRLGLDIGTNSIGWCLIEDDKRIVDVGVRIFGYSPSGAGRDSKSGTSLAVERRQARAMRRRRDRYLGRRSAFLKTLIEHGLMPANADEAKLVAESDPYTLRARALNEKLEPHEIGRALFHLNQRRGFKSNRKADRKAKPGEEGKIASGARELVQAMAEDGADTLGEFLAGRPVKRVRLDSDNQEYDFYPQRSDIAHEFQRIWDEQSKHYPTLMTESTLTWRQLDARLTKRENGWDPKEARDALYRILFFQRPLKEQQVGYCTFGGMSGVPADERRLPKAHPLFQQRRLYEEVNQLRVVSAGAADRALTLDERDRLVKTLQEKKAIKFETLAEKVLKLAEGERFNKESESRKELIGDEVRAEMSSKKRFGNDWLHFGLDEQLRIIDRLRNEENPEVLLGWLKSEYGLDDATAEAVANARLPEGYGRFGKTATTRLLDALKNESFELEDGKRRPVTYNEAVEIAFGRSHSDFRDGLVHDRLPYYGEILTREIAPGKEEYGDEKERRFGKITNPTVHIGMRQLEKLVNAIIAVHGRPDQIVVELARELKLNKKQKDEHKKRIGKDTQDAQRRSRALLGVDGDGNPIGDPVADDNGANRAKLKLWEELNPGNLLDRRCPYCGDPNRTIGIAMLFSDEVDIDHIIPYSRSLDDSAGNKVVAHRNCNRAKGNKTPYEKWGPPHVDPERWDRISDQVARMHKSKQWRFGPDAMERVNGEKGFLARQLTDTQYLSRLAGKYLRSLYATKDEGRVYVVPGRMTAMLRRLWALNDVLDDSKFVENKNSNAPKNRLDHRHHAIDAYVCAVTSEALLMRIAEAAGRAENKDLDRMFEGLPEPWPGYLQELNNKLARVTVSHKPDHGRKGGPSKYRDITAGRLHNDTAYGLTGEIAADGKTPIVVHRVPFMSLKPGDLTDPQRIPDAELRDALYGATRDRSGKDFEQALARFSKEHPVFRGIRRVRVREPLNVIAIRDRQGRAYKAYKGDANARFDVWRLPNGKWTSDIVSMFDAHRSDQQDRRPHPAAKKMLSLRQNDILAIERNGGPPQIVRVVKFSTIGTIALAGDNEAGALKARDAAPNDVDPFKYVLSSAGGLKGLRARQVRIDPLGRVFDPGPRE
ncbi:MAG: type II CRISPR RNA-guided endonuclease Cas9 [Qipengyuania sp.]|nr:type II CRISPR RNA-guided endonuclease Cas9 [Qipengyuania sp.]